MKTSQRQIFRGGEVKSMFSQEDFLASRSVLQASERERKITVISGRKCYEQYGKFSLLGLLVKMLMVSSQWYSPARMLKWDARTLCSRRITYTEQSSNSQSMPSAKTLSVLDIRSNRLLFRLVPSEHLTEETGCGLLQDLIPTPIASDAQGGAGRGSQTCKREKTSKRASVFRNIERPCGEQDVANPANARSESVQQGRKDRISEFGVVAHAKGARSARELFGKQEQIQSDRQNCRIDKPDFADFPTQSPVCSRNDGLPFRVADLTISFPKWRSKSIEALGNAWVPQVAFEIFKAINEIQKKSV